MTTYEYFTEYIIQGRVSPYRTGKFLADIANDDPSPLSITPVRIGAFSGDILHDNIGPSVANYNPMRPKPDGSKGWHKLDPTIVSLTYRPANPAATKFDKPHNGSHGERTTNTLTSRSGSFLLAGVVHLPENEELEAKITQGLTVAGNGLVLVQNDEGIRPLPDFTHQLTIQRVITGESESERIRL